VLKSICGQAGSDFLSFPKVDRFLVDKSPSDAQPHFDHIFICCDK
jgi:hypothetical protein